MNLSTVSYAAFWIFPALMQRVHTLIVFVELFTTALTFLRLGFQRRLVLLFAWLTLFPKEGIFSQISHFFANVLSSVSD
jgi:hypothetical protein